MKHKGLLMVLICVMILSGCNRDIAILSGHKDSDNLQKQGKEISRADLSTEGGIREYLVGEWNFDQAYVSDVICTINIDEDLNVSFVFHDTCADESRGHYSGKINLERIYANPNQAPDLISIELIDTDYPGGDFFFLHRTHYDGKFVMSWFFAGNGNCIFDMIGSEDFAYVPAEIILEKENKEKSKLLPRKNEEFHAVFWGKGVDGQRLWLDDVQWAPPEQDDFERDYPERMTLYQNDVLESTLYNISPDRISDILGDDLFPGEVYFVQTDGKGQIIDFISPEYKEFLEKDFDDDVEPGIEDFVFDSIQDVEEINEYIKAGMTILFSEETIILEGEECYQFALGINHQEHFVQEIFYAVNTFTRQLYRYDVIMDIWESVPMG